MPSSITSDLSGYLLRSTKLCSFRIRVNILNKELNKYHRLNHGYHMRDELFQKRRPTRNFWNDKINCTKQTQFRGNNKKVNCQVYVYKIHTNWETTKLARILKEWMKQNDEPTRNWWAIGIVRNRLYHKVINETIMEFTTETLKEINNKFVTRKFIHESRSIVWSVRMGTFDRKDYGGSDMFRARSQNERHIVPRPPG